MLRKQVAEAKPAVGLYGPPAGLLLSRTWMRHSGSSPGVLLIPSSCLFPHLAADAYDGVLLESHSYAVKPSESRLLTSGRSPLTKFL